MLKRFMLFFGVLGLLLSAVLVLGVPGRIGIELFDDAYEAGEILDGEVSLHLNTTLDPGTMMEAKIGLLTSRRLLTDILASESIPYGISGGTFEVTSPSSAKTMVFPQAGSQLIFFKMSPHSAVTSVGMHLHGMPYGNGSYPSFPTIDVGLDGDAEWAYAAGLNGYGSDVTPAGLNEQENGGVASLTGRKVHYCEIIDLPKAKDFKVMVKHRQHLAGGNISAVMLSMTQSGQTVQGQGGTESCDLPEAGNSLAYTSCEIHLPVFVEGRRLICTFNSNATPAGNTTQTYFHVQMDASASVTQPSSYVCGPLSSTGATSCTAHTNDFFIKVKAGNYSGEMKQQVPFSSGLTEFSFKDALNEHLSDCSTAECIIPLKFSSASAGVIYADTLQVAYTQGSSGGLFTYNTFYDGTSSGGAINSVNGASLTSGNTTVTFPLDALFVAAPKYNATRNITLSVEVIPGPAIKTNVTVLGAVSAAPADAGEMIRAYTTILTTISSVHPALLTALGYKSDVDAGISTLQSYLSQYTALNGSSMTQAQKDTARANITANMNMLMDDMPESLVISKKVSDVIIVGVTDFSDQAVLPHQRTQAEKDKLAVFQDRMTVEGTAEYYILEFFNGNEERGTLITKKVSGSASNAYVVEVLPGEQANSITFLDTPEVVQPSGPAIVRWSHPSFSGAEFRYLLAGDKVATLKNFKTIVVPQTVPDLTPARPPAVSYTCGDGICSVLETDQGAIPLETSFTCPKDCARTWPYTTWLVALLALIAIAWYLNFYHGKYGFDDLMNRMKGTKGMSLTKEKKPGTSALELFAHKGEKTEKKLFISAADEQSVVSYAENALKKGFSKSKISEALLAKGWTREQVEYAFSKPKK